MRLAEVTNKMHIRLTFIDECLGTAPNSEEVYREFIASKAPDAPSREEELENIPVDEMAENGMTVFLREDDGTPVMFNYQIRGFFKSACKALKDIEISESYKKRSNFKKAIDLGVFVFEDINDRGRRKIILDVPQGGEIGSCQRPLRAQTQQGERIALASSETVPAGTVMDFWIETVYPDDIEAVREWLDFGAYNGLGQWRNSGKGAFVWEELYATDKDPDFIQVPVKQKAAAKKTADATDSGEKKTRGRKKKEEASDAS